MTRFTPLLGIATILGAVVVFSKDRRAIRWRIVAWGFGLQILMAVFVLRTNLGYRLIDGASRVAVRMLSFSFEGSRFVFGWLGDPKGSAGFVFAFQALPMIIYVAAFFSILYYLRVLPLL
ncbi:MAG: NupC/NupG family nucleoside CNT transporter, partial [Acidobacteria bacterium]